MISSEARRALVCRGPWDVINLASVWGLGQERGREAVGSEARSVVVQAEMKRRSFRGVVDVIYGGEKPEKVLQKEDGQNGKGKRKAESIDYRVGKDGEEAKTPSKREQKRQAKKARLDVPDSTENKAEHLLEKHAASSAPDQPASVELIADGG